MNKFEAFKEKSYVLENKLAQVEEILLALQGNETQKELIQDLENHLDNLNVLKEKLTSNTFKTLVIGEFKRGKSTFINALLKEEVLPAYPTPCTAVINEVKWGEVKKATIYFKKEIVQLSEGLSEVVKEHIEIHKGKNIPPLEIDFKDLEENVVISDPGKEQAQSIFESPFAKAVITYPLDICKNGVEIIDSPGLNENATRTAITDNYIGNVDAVIFVLLCDPLASASEMEAIERIYTLQGHKSIFYVCNRFDNIRNEKDRMRVMDFARKKLLPYTNLGERGLHFVSSRDALDFYTEIPPDPVKLEQSRFVPMTNNLVDFLINDRGRLKLQQPTESAITILEHTVDDIIQAVLQGMTRNLEQLKEAQKKQEKQAEELKQQAELEMQNLHGKVDNICNTVSNELTNFVKISSAKIPEWLKDYEPQASLGLIGTKSAVEAITKELAGYVTQCLEEEKSSWEQNVMTPILQQKLDDFKRSKNEAIRKIGVKLVEINDEFNQKETQIEEDFLPQFNSMTGIDDSMFEGLIASAIPGVLVGLGVALVGILSPWILIPAVLTAIAGGKVFSNESRMEKIKEQVGKLMAEQFLTSGLSKVSEASKPFSEKLNFMINDISKKLIHEINHSEANAKRQLEICQLEGRKLEEKKVFFTKIGAKKDQLISEFKAIIVDLSNPSYDLSAGASEDLFTVVAKHSTADNSQQTLSEKIMQTGEKVLSNAGLKTEVQSNLQEQDGVSEEEQVQIEDKTQQISAQQRTGIFARLLDHFKR